MNFKIHLEKLSQNLFNPKKPTWIIITLILMAITLSQFQKNDPNLKKEETKLPTNIDTYVPSGFVLVPLQLTNGDSIDSMVGDFCLVDLYPSSLDVSPDAQPNHRGALATHLRLVRAPNNPSLFGVLVPEENRTLVHKLTSPVFAVIQGPNAKKESLPEQKTIPRSRVIKYGDLL